MNLILLIYILNLITNLAIQAKTPRQSFRMKYCLSDNSHHFNVVAFKKFENLNIFKRKKKFRMYLHNMEYFESKIRFLNTRGCRFDLYELFECLDFHKEYIYKLTKFDVNVLVDSMRDLYSRFRDLSKDSDDLEVELVLVEIDGIIKTQEAIISGVIHEGRLQLLNVKLMDLIKN